MAVCHCIPCVLILIMLKCMPIQHMGALVSKSGSIKVISSQARRNPSFLRRRYARRLRKRKSDHDGAVAAEAVLVPALVIAVAVAQLVIAVAVVALVIARVAVVAVAAGSIEGVQLC